MAIFEVYHVTRFSRIVKDNKLNALLFSPDFLYQTFCSQAITLKCMVRRLTARGLKLSEATVCVNVSGLLVENRSPGTR